MKLIALGLDELPDRKPNDFGRAAAARRDGPAMAGSRSVLMDEPLSNLDAKLRVQTRAEIPRIQHDLGVTTIYVTHDQTEAMTMGDRVAVLRKGMLQQVDTPQTFYEMPVNIFVAGFIGSPTMNLIEAELRRMDDGLVVDVGGFRLPIPAEVEAARPDLRNYVDRTIVLGVRPEDMEDAALVTDAPAERRSLRSSNSASRSAPTSSSLHDRGPSAHHGGREGVGRRVGEDVLQQVDSRRRAGAPPIIAR